MIQKVLPMAGIVLFALLSGTVTDMSALSANIKSNLIVLLGTFVCCMISYTPSKFMALAVGIKSAVGAKNPEPAELIDEIQELASFRRIHGDFELDKRTGAIENPFLKMGIEMVVDGYDRYAVFKTLERRYDNFLSERRSQADLLNTMIKLLPVFGFVGTIIGLIDVLNHMGAAEVIGRGVATALLTTFYGMLYANILLLPLSKKLSEQTRTDAVTRALILEGVLDICENANPRSIGYRLRYCIGEISRDDATVGRSLVRNHSGQIQHLEEMDSSLNLR